MYNWQNPEWPEFQFDAAEFAKHEREFLKKAGQIDGKFMYFTKQQSELTLVDLLVSEAILLVVDVQTSQLSQTYFAESFHQE